MLRYVVPIAAVHALALAALVPALFSWTALVACLVGQASTIGYHRLLAHRSFSTKRWFEHLLVLGALCCLEDSPARWIATHRMHHAHSDEEEDPHSPLVAFAWGHLWWLLVRNRDLHHRSSYERYARDILADPFYMWVEKRPWSPLWIYAAHAALYAVVAFCAALAWTGPGGVALFACGEGWHNNHHSDPARCSVSQRWWEVDVSHLEVRALSLVGVTWDIVPGREVRRARAIEAHASAGSSKT